jgi:uncharacterized membrane protein required for colicin V production
MNTLDIVIVLLCLGSAVLGAVLGPLRQISKFGGLALGLVLAKKYAGWAQDVMRLRFTHGDAVAYVAVLVAVYVAARLVGYAVEHSLRGDKLSGSERLTGALAGLVHGAALSVVVVFFLVAVSPRGAAVFRDSKAAPTAIAVGGWIQPVFPGAVREPFREKTSAAQSRGNKEEVREKEKAAESAPSAPASPQPKNRSRK